MARGGLSSIIPILRDRGHGRHFCQRSFTGVEFFRNVPFLPRLYLTVVRQTSGRTFYLVNFIQAERKKIPCCADFLLSRFLCCSVYVRLPRANRATLNSTTPSPSALLTRASRWTYGFQWPSLISFNRSRSLQRAEILRSKRPPSRSMATRCFMPTLTKRTSLNTTSP